MNMGDRAGKPGSEGPRPLVLPHLKQLWCALVGLPSLVDDRGSIDVDPHPVGERVDFIVGPVPKNGMSLRGQYRAARQADMKDPGRIVVNLAAEKHGVAGVFESELDESVGSVKGEEIVALVSGTSDGKRLHCSRWLLRKLNIHLKLSVVCPADPLQGGHG